MEQPRDRKKGQRGEDFEIYILLLLTGANCSSSGRCDVLAMGREVIGEVQEVIKNQEAEQRVTSSRVRLKSV